MSVLAWKAKCGFAHSVRFRCSPPHNGKKMSEINKLTYRNGHKPKVGDMIKLAPNNAFNYDSQLGGYNKLKWANTIFVVLEVNMGVKSMLIRIKPFAEKPNIPFDNINFMKASNFNLHTPADASAVGAANGKYKYVVMSDDNHCIGFANTQDILDQKMAELLSENPTKTYRIFKYAATAKTSAPKVEYFDEINDNMPSVVNTKKFTLK